MRFDLTIVPFYRNQAPPYLRHQIKKCPYIMIIGGILPKLVALGIHNVIMIKYLPETTLPDVVFWCIMIKFRFPFSWVEIAPFFAKKPHIFDLSFRFQPILKFDR
jgi:hypothetical protein